MVWARGATQSSQATGLSCITVLFHPKYDYFGLHSKPDTSQMPEGNLEDWFKWFLKFLEGGQEQNGGRYAGIWFCQCWVH
jgi:hypothetical protein